MSIHLHATELADAEWTLDTEQKVDTRAHMNADVTLWSRHGRPTGELAPADARGRWRVGRRVGLAAAEEWRPAT